MQQGQGQGGGFGAPQPAPAPVGPVAPKKKSKATGCIIAGCGGCLLVALGLCVLGGYALYLEEGYAYGEPGEEVQSIPIAAGTPFSMIYTWDGMGYAHHDFWLEVTGVADPSGEFALSGQMGCDRFGEPFMRDVQASLSDYRVARHTQNPDGTFSAWIAVHDEYDRSTGTPTTCVGTLTPVFGQMTTARLVLTRKQRPSDMMAF